jgi:hypothetical protein
MSIDQVQLLEHTQAWQLIYDTHVRIAVCPELLQVQNKHINKDKHSQSDSISSNTVAQNYSGSVRDSSAAAASLVQDVR